MQAPKDQMCESTPPNHEDGIDMPTSNQLLSRQGLIPHATPETKWKNIWMVLFPSDSMEREAIPTYGKRSDLVTGGRNR